MAQEEPKSIIAVEVERPSRPAIWLDTSALINITKARSGRLKHEADHKRVTEIDRVVTEKVRAGRLLSIDSEQRNEAWKSGWDDFVETLESLSVGTSMRPLLSVQNAQFEVAMMAYLQGASSMRVPLEVFFDEDPVKATDEVRRRRMSITVRVPQSEELRRHKREKNQELWAGLERTRLESVAKGVTFDQQLAAESRATLKAYIDLYACAALSHLLDPQMTNRETFWQSMGGMALPEVADLWKHHGGKLAELGRFFDSEHFRALPQQDIQSRVYAALMTQREPIKSGDAGDVDHLALVLPIATFVLTDKRMERRLYDLGLDEKWGARVFSLASTDQLISALDAL